MDWRVKGNMTDGLLFCATFTSCNRGHTPYTPFLQAEAETSDSSVEGTRCSWRGHSSGVGVDVWDDSTASKKLKVIGCYPGD